MIAVLVKRPSLVIPPIVLPTALYYGMLNDRSQRSRIVIAVGAHGGPWSYVKNLSQVLPMASTFDRESLWQVQMVPLTAFDSRGMLSLEPMQHNTQRLLDAGVKVFIPCAGSSEFHTLTADEIVSAVEMTCQVVGSRASVLAPVGLQLSHAADIGRRALQAGASGVLVMPLGFPYLSDDGARDYYSQLIKQLECPTIVYKKAPLPSDRLLLELAQLEHVVGVKYAVNDISAFQTIVHQDEGRIDWFCGSAERFAPFFALAGARGYTSGAGNICPRLTLSMHASQSRGDWDEALRLQKIILPIEYYRARDDSSYNVSFLKYAMKHLDLDFGDPRPPYRQLTTAEMQEIDDIIAPILEAERTMIESLTA